MDPQFDQRPGELEATRGLTRELPVVTIAHDAAADSGVHALMVCAALEVQLTPAQMRALARNLLWTADLIDPEEDDS